MKYIYDVFHNDNNKLIIIMPAECNPPLINYIYRKSNIPFKLHVCPHKPTYINMQNNIHIGNFLDKLIISQGINTTKIGSFRIMNRTFTNPDKLSV